TLQLVGQREVLDDKRVELESQLGECWRETLPHRLSQLVEIRRHVEEGNLTRRERVGHAADDGVPQLAFEIGDLVYVASAADALVKDQWIDEVVRVDPVATQPHHPEILVADRYRVLRSPTLIDLHPR